MSWFPASFWIFVAFTCKTNQMPTLLLTVRFAGATIAGNLGAPIEPANFTQRSAMAGDDDDNDGQYPYWEPDPSVDEAVGEFRGLVGLP